jgi:hypothetical protein
MLSKCANAPCHNVFRYLREGKLFLIDSGSALQRKRRLEDAGKARPHEYAWLCASCCNYLTIRIHDELGAVVVPKTAELTGKDISGLDQVLPHARQS